MGCGPSENGVCPNRGLFEKDNIPIDIGHDKGHTLLLLGAHPPAQNDNGKDFTYYNAE